MEDFNSKYSGEQVEELLDQVASGNTGGGGGGGITVETDPIFSASPAASITEEKITEWNSKQDKIADIDSIRNGASKGASSAQQELLQTGASAVVVPNGVFVDGEGSTYALPDVDETTKETVAYVLATEDYVDSKVGSGGSGSGSGKEIVEVEPIFEPGGSTGSFMTENPLQPNKVYVFTETLSSLYINSIEVSNSIVDEYTIMFTAAATKVVISINNNYQVHWANGVIQSLAEGDMCELSLVRIGNNIKAVLANFRTVQQ